MMSFTRIRGQKRAVAFFTRAVAADRLGHAYLFSGPDGVGKKTFAELLAGFLLCTQRDGLAPCGRCGGCRKFSSGNHPDFIRIVPDGAAIKIGQLRELKEAVAFSPFEGGYRIILLEDVHTMRREAGNSLLKLLEEPPEDNIFILTGSSLNAVLPTIVSRCQEVGFSPLPLDDAVDILRRLRAELSAGEATLLATLADGCPGRALVLETEGIFELYSTFCRALTEKADNEAQRIEHALSLAAELAALKEGLPYFFQLLRIFFKDLMLAKVQRRNDQAFSDEVNRAREMWNLNELSDKIAAVDLAEKALDRNCSRGLACEVLLLDLFEGGLR